MATDIQLGQKAEDLEFSHDQLLQQPGETPEAYVDRLSKVPKDRLNQFEKDEEERQYQQAIVPQPDEDTDTFANRLASSLTPDQLDRYEKEQEEAQRKEQLKESYRGKVVAPYAVAPLMGAAEAATAGLITPAAAGISTGISKLNEWWNDLPEEQKQTWADTYNKELDEMEAIRGAYREAAPKSYIAGGLAGVTVPFSRIGALTNTLPKALAADTVYSAMTGAAESEGRLTGKHADATQVLNDALQGGVYGLAGSAAFRSAIAGLKSGVQLTGETAVDLANKISKVGIDLDAKVDSAMHPTASTEFVKASEMLTETQSRLNSVTDLRIKDKLNKEIKQLNEFLDSKKSVEFKEKVLSQEVLKPLPSFKEWANTLDDQSKKLLATEAPQNARLLGSEFGIPTEQMTDWLAYSTVSQNKMKLDQWLSSNGFKDGIEQALKTAKKGYVEDTFNWIRKGKYAQDIINKSLVKESPLGNRISRIGLVMADGRYAASAIDAKWGTKIATYMDSLSNKYNLYTNISAAFQKEINKATQLAKKAGLLESEATYHSPSAERTVTRNKLIAALESEQIRKTLTKPELDAVEKFQKIFEDGRTLANKLGLNVEKLPNYVPAKSLSPEKYLKEVKSRLASFGKEFEDPNEFVKAKEFSRDFRELLSSLERISDVKITSFEKFRQATRSLNQPFSKIYKGLTRAAATYKREGGIPSFVQETDVPKLASAWVNNTFYNLHMADDVLKLQAMARQLKAKDKVAAQWLSNLANDITGTRDTLASNFKRYVESSKLALEQKLNESPNLANKLALNVRLLLPKAVTFLAHQIYPSSLGLNARVVVRNLTQPWMMASGELSGLGKSMSPVYGMKRIMQGQADVFTLRNLHIKDEAGQVYTGLKGVLKVLEDRGVAPSKLQWESAEDAIQSGLKKFPRKVVDKANDVSMALFTASELNNRAVAYFSGLRVADDLVGALEKGLSKTNLTRNEQASLEFVKAMQPGYRVEMRSLFSSYLKDPTPATKEEIRQKVAKYLVAKTQFNYDPIALSEFGRSMGWMFSMFTKWPLSIASDMTRKIKDFGSAGGFKVGTQYTAPLVAAWAADQMFKEQLKDPKSRMRLLVGQSFVDALPIQSVTSFKDPVRSSVMIDLANKGIQSVASRDPKELSKFAERMFRQHTPGSQYVRFFTEDIPTLMEGKNPKTIHEMFKVD